MVRGMSTLHARTVGLVAIGGMLGSNLRYSLGAVAGEGLLLTILVNGIGSFGLGLLLFDKRVTDLLSTRLRYLFGTGFFASFTSYSTFIADIGATAGPTAVVYVTASYGAGIGGILISRQVLAVYSAEGVSRIQPGED